jgi:hypothetical protein
VASPPILDASDTKGNPSRDQRGFILWSDTRFDQAHRLYTWMGFLQTGERTLLDDLNATREYGFERIV